MVAEEFEDAPEGCFYLEHRRRRPIELKYFDR
jgi:hypothetical protein